MVASRCQQHDRETVAPAVSAAGPDLESTLGRGREELLEFVGILRMPDSIAQQHHAIFQIPRLPGVQKPVGGGEGGNVTRV